MKAPDRWPRWEPYEVTTDWRPHSPTVYPTDIEVREGLLGPDGRPITPGKKRKNPLGFSRPERDDQ